ncbi:MAG: hypothetical protein ABR548_10290 [Actinomycetota bacterium]|nr:hypothetical protein [Actinomycetota bacterium]
MPEQRKTEPRRRPPASPRRGREREDWSAPVPLGGGWRLQYHKATGEEFTHYRLLPPPNACKEGQPRDLPRITALDTLRVLPWLQRMFKSPDGPRLFRPLACGEPGAVDKAQRDLRVVDKQARVWTEREGPA